MQLVLKFSNISLAPPDCNPKFKQSATLQKEEEVVQERK